MSMTDQTAMSMTDPIADMLTRLRNANSAYHDTVGMPYSKIKSHIAEILQQEGYIASWRVEDAEVGKNLVVTLKYGNARERSIAGIKRVSKPGLRVYAKKDNLPRVLGKLKAHVAQVLLDQGYIAGYRTEDATVGKSLVVDLKYGPNRERSIAGIKRVSKPGLRVYAKSTELPRVLGGLGVAIISTSAGLLTDRQAHQRRMGGEVLAFVW